MEESSQEPKPSSNNPDLYELPACTICLSELSQDISNLACGHTFHLSCIAQHFQYKGTCPNCQKRATAKELRPVVYSVLKNNQNTSLMKELLKNFSQSEKTQIESLFQQLQASTQKSQRYEESIKDFEKRHADHNAKILKLQKELVNQKCNAEAIMKAKQHYSKVIDNLNSEIRSLRDEALEREIELEKYRQNESEYAKMRKLKKIMSESSESIVSYKNELEAKQTPPQEIVKLFYDMIMIKNLEIIKYKNRVEDYPEKVSELSQELANAKSKLEKAQKQIQILNEKRHLEKTKHEELKLNYKRLKNQYLGLEKSMDEESLSRGGSFPLVPIKEENNRQPINSEVNYRSSFEDQLRSANQQGRQKIQTSQKNLSSFGFLQKKETNTSYERSDFISTPQPLKNQQVFGSFGGLKKKAEDKKAPSIKNFF